MSVVIPSPVPVKGSGAVHDGSSSLAQAVSALRAESALYRELLRRHVVVCPDQPPTAAVSAGTYAKALLRASGLKAPLVRMPEFGRETLAASAGSYFAGEVFVQVRGTDLPVRLLDFGGAYPIAAILARAWRYMTAENLATEDLDPEHCEASLERLASEFLAFVRGEGDAPGRDLFEEAAWTVVFVEPDGTNLPHRTRLGETWSAGRAPLTYSKESVPYTAADLLVHLLQGGSMPRITGAFRFVPSGRLTLRAVSSPAGRVIDPNHEDLIEALWNERGVVEHGIARDQRERANLRGLLKGILVSLVSGLPMQVNDDEPTKALRDQVVYDPRNGRPGLLKRNRIERPAEWYLPPLAAAVTSTARLLLYLPIGMVREAGGMVAYGDTDSLSVIATPEGGLFPFPGAPELTDDGGPAVRALSFVELEDIRWRIESLLPSPEEAMPFEYVTDGNGIWAKVRTPGLLRLEPENRIGPRGFSADIRLAPRAQKKYAAYLAEYRGPHVEVRDGESIVVQPKPGPAGLVLSLRVLRGSEHGLPFAAPNGQPDWVSQGFEHLLGASLGLSIAPPAAWEESATMLVPASTPELVGVHPEARPFCTLAVQHVALLGPVVAPMHPSFDPVEADWRDLEGNPIKTNLAGISSARTLGDAQLAAWRSFDKRSLGPDGAPVGAASTGVMRPAPTRATAVVLIGKESRHLGVDRYVSGPDIAKLGGDDRWLDVVEAARRLSLESVVRQRLCDEAEISGRALGYLLAGERSPRQVTRDALTRATAREARKAIRRADAYVPIPPEDLDALAAYLDLPAPTRRCEHCGRPLEGKARRWCSDACRKSHSRPEQLRLIVKE